MRSVGKQEIESRGHFEFEENSEQRKKKSSKQFVNMICCSLWLMNSVFGFIIIQMSPELKVEEPNLYYYIVLFSAKWLWSLIIAFLILIGSSCCV